MSGTIYFASTSEELYDALGMAQGGDTIRLAEGDYGDLVINEQMGFDVTYDSPVTIVSDDPAAPASFSTMALYGVSNLTFDNVVFDYTYDSADEIWAAPFQVMNSDAVTIQNSVFDGDVASGLSEVDDGYGFAYGLNIRDSSGISVIDNEFTTWHRGMVVNDSQDITVQGNDMHSIRSDGMDFAAVQGVVIEDNYIHDFAASPESTDHADMIQFWTSGTDTPSTDITIRNNVLDIGDGAITQSIFMRNEVVDQGLGGEEMYYQNVVIEENVIRNGHSHGITVGETNGLAIQNNTILSIDATDDRYFSAPTINLSVPSESVVVQNNAVAGITGTDGGDGFVLSNNAFIQNTNPDLPGYYGDQFLDSSMYDSQGAGNIIVAPDSMVANLDAGASRLTLDTAPDSLTPEFDVNASTEVSQTLIFDASHTYGPTGEVLPGDATFLWDFGDGTTATGRIVEHGYQTAGDYDVTLEVRTGTPEGTVVASTHANVGIAGDDILAFDSATGQFISQGYGIDTPLEGTEAASVMTPEGMAIDLGGTGVALEVPKEDISHFFGSDAFEISMTLQADQPGASWGEVARVHGSFIVSVQEDGDLSLRLFPESGGEVDLQTQGVAINDGNVHDISIQFDDAADSVQIIVDGQVAASETMTGSMSEMGSWGLTFGEPWGGQNFDGTLYAFDLNATSSDYSDFEGSLPPAEDKTELPVVDDYVLDFANLSDNQLKGGATVVEDGGDSFVQLDSKSDFVRIGPQDQAQSDLVRSDQIAVSVDFQKADATDGDMRVAWNYQEVGITVEENGLTINFGQADTKFRDSSVHIDNLGLDDTEIHNTVVLLDETTDRLQVILDGEVVLDEQQSADIEFGNDNGVRRDGWTLGSARHHDFAGDIYDFSLDSTADFINDPALLPDDSQLIG